MTGRASWAALRNIPLEQVAAALGYRRDPADRTRWTHLDSVLSINGTRFFDHRRGTGGGGAIDLVIHTRHCRFGDALDILAGHDRSPAGDAVTRPERSLQLPRPCQHAWPAVRDALVRQRALPAELLEAGLRRGLIHADARRNAVFLCRNARQQPTGAEILGTANERDGCRYKGMAPGSRKADGGFWLPCDRHRPQVVILAESAVDAISARSLRIPGTGERGAVVVSTAGTASIVPPWIEAWNPTRIICAWDADHTGNRAAERLRSRDPRVARQRPERGKDWNEMLTLRSR